MRKIDRYLSKYKTPKTELARMIDILPADLYAYTEPSKYARPLSDRVIEKIAAFEGCAPKSIRADYESRRNAAA